MNLALCSAATVLIALGAAGCESRQSQASSPQAPADFRQYSTPELKSRLEVVHRRYAEISREVEHKSGLPMGVTIRDDRALLGELYREAHEIQRELARRGDSSSSADFANAVR